MNDNHLILMSSEVQLIFLGLSFSEVIVVIMFSFAQDAQNLFLPPLTSFVKIVHISQQYHHDSS